MPKQEQVESVLSEDAILRGCVKVARREGAITAEEAKRAMEYLDLVERLAIDARSESR